MYGFSAKSNSRPLNILGLLMRQCVEGHFEQQVRRIKVAFLRKYDAFFSLSKECAKDYPEKRYFEIAFYVESADSYCTTVSKGGEIQNTKHRIEGSTFFGVMEIIPIFFREYRTFIGVCLWVFFWACLGVLDENVKILFS